MRHSIITKYEKYSAFSGAPMEAKHHCVFGRGMRNKAEEDGLWIPLLDSEHNASSRGTIYQIHENPAAEKLSKMLGQAAWESQWLAKKLEQVGNDGFMAKKTAEEWREKAREEFRKRYTESFL